MRFCSCCCCFCSGQDDEMWWFYLFLFIHFKALLCQNKFWIGLLLSLPFAAGVLIRGPMKSSRWDWLTKQHNSVCCWLFTVILWDVNVHPIKTFFFLEPSKYLQKLSKVLPFKVQYVLCTSAKVWPWWRPVFPLKKKVLPVCGVGVENQMMNTEMSLPFFNTGELN